MNLNSEEPGLAAEKEWRRIVLPLLCLFSLFILFGHIHINNPGGHALFIPFNTTSWIPVFLLLGLGFWKIGSSGELHFTPLSRQLLLTGLLLSLPLFYLNAEIGQSAFRMIGLWAGFGVLVTLQQFRFNRESLAWILLLILAAVWIETLRYWWVMLDSYLTYGQVPSDYQYGIWGVFQQRNVFASFIATGLVLSGYLLAQSSTLRFGRYLVPLLMLAPVFMYQLLVSSASRAGWYGAMIGSVLVLPLIYRAIPRSLFCIWFIAWLAGYGISEIVISVGNFNVPDKNILSFSGDGRAYLFLQSILMFFNKPWFGFGYGNFEFSYIHFAAEQFALGKISNPGIAETYHPHNEFLLWGVEGGIVPVIGLLVAAWAVWRSVCKLELLQRLAIIGVFFPLALHSQVEFPFYASVMHWIIFILLIHHVDSLANATTTRPLAARKSLQVAGVVVPALATLFLVTTIQAGVIYSRYLETRLPLTALADVKNAVVWRNHLNWAINSAALLVGRDNERPDLIQRYIDWAPHMIAQQPRPLFYEYLVLAYLSLNRTDEADAVIAEFRYLFPGREFNVITVE